MPAELGIIVEQLDRLGQVERLGVVGSSSTSASEIPVLARKRFSRVPIRSTKSQSIYEGASKLPRDRSVRRGHDGECTPTSARSRERPSSARFTAERQHHAAYPPNK
jgi:hypothetical protein